MKAALLRTWALTAGGLGAATLVGCSMPNSSNPTLSINQAKVSGDTASLAMQIDNPSDMDLHVESANWSLLYGPLPVAEGDWDLGVSVPRGSSYQFSRDVRFDAPPLDPNAGEVELTGSLDVRTVGDQGNTALHGAGFSTSRKVSR